MTTDTGPSSLFKLSFNSVVKLAENCIMRIEDHTFPKDIGEQILKYFNPLEILPHASLNLHFETADWFHYKVIAPMQLKLFVRYEHREYNIRLGNPDLKKTWLKWRLSAENASPECFTVKIANVELRTKTHDFGKKWFTSYMPDNPYAPIDIIEWICTVLRCDVYDMGFDAYGRDYRILKNYPQVKVCDHLTLINCRSMSDLIIDRQGRKMKTTLINPRFNEWHTLDWVLSRHTIVKDGFFNLERVTPPQLSQFIQQMTNRNLEIIELKVANCSLETIENLKEQIGLKDSSQELMESLERDFVSSELNFARRTEEHTKLFFFNEDGSVVGFYFYRSQHNVSPIATNFFHTILCHGFSPKK